MVYVEIELYLSLSVANSKHILSKCDDSLWWRSVMKSVLLQELLMVLTFSGCLSHGAIVRPDRPGWWWGADSVRIYRGENICVILELLANININYSLKLSPKLSQYCYCRAVCRTKISWLTWRRSAWSPFTGSRGKITTRLPGWAAGWSAAGQGNRRRNNENLNISQ